jgi:ribosomal protein L29
MDIRKLVASEMISMDLAKSLELEGSIRKRLQDIRMDIYTPEQQNAGEIRSLRKSLARILTVRSLNSKK